MPKENQIPNIDQKLAKKVGTILDENRSVLSADDYLVDQIVDHKKRLYLTYEDELRESKEASWREISSSIQTGKKRGPKGTKESNIHALFASRSTILKVAAAVVITAFLTIFFFQYDFQDPEILTEANNEKVTYTFNEGGNVQLRPHSTLYLISRSDEEYRYRLDGEAYFQVNKNDNRRFIVEAGSGIIEVTGTSFNVREWGDETIVYLQEGSVDFSNSTGSEKVQLAPGEMAAVNKDLSITAPEKTESEPYLSWQQDQLVFENRTAESIFNELEYHYSIEIDAPDHIKNEVLGGTLSLESRSVSLENLGIVLGGNFSSITEDTYQFVE